jgi:hypothetical protein
VFRDDWTEHMRRLSLAQIGPNGELLDDFDQMMQMQRGEQAALRVDAPFVRTVPPSFSKALLGSQVTAKASGPEVEAARWAADADEEASSITISVTPLQDTMTANGIFLPYLILRWGSRGQINYAKIDICRGIQLSVCASAVVANIVLEGTGIAASTLMDFSASLASGVCVRTQPLTSTLFFNNLEGGTVSNRFDIPKFSKSVLFWRADASQAMSINLKSYATATLWSFTRAAAAASGETAAFDSLLLSGDCASFTLSNGAAGGSFCDVRVVFELML